MNIGLQLYTLRHLGSLENQLALATSCGYKRVESVGFHDLVVDAALKTFADFQVTVASAHFDYPEFENRFTEILGFLSGAACTVAVMPWLPPDARPVTRAKWESLGAQLQDWAVALQEQGVRLAYHNHDFEFERFGAATGLDILLANSLVNWQPDIGWLAFANEDIHALLTRYQHKICSVHAKDVDPDGGQGDDVWRDIGEGIVDWPMILSDLAKSGNVDYFVEHDATPDDRRTLTTGREQLQKLQHSLLPEST